VIPNDAVGVLEPSGRFVVVKLSDGKVVVDQKLEPEDGLASIQLLHSTNKYFLMTSSTNSVHDPNISIQSVPAGVQGVNPLVNGWLYAFDHQTGKKAWPHPVSLREDGAQGLVFHQPHDLPLMFFLSHRHKTSGQNHHEVRARVLVVDKRNGRVVSNFEIPSAVNNF